MNFRVQLSSYPLAPIVQFQSRKQEVFCFVLQIPVGIISM